MGDSTGKSYFSLAINEILDLNFVSPASGGSQTLPFYIYDDKGNRTDNVTDWGLAQFQQQYQNPVIARSEATKQSRGDSDCHADARNDNRVITKLAIFHYVYAVLHDPIYREKYALNLKREFPHVPFMPIFGNGQIGAVL